MELPAAFERQMKNLLGTEYQDFREAVEQSAPVSIRVNPFKTGRGQDMEKVPWSEYGYYLKSRPIFTLDPLFHAGVYYVQEASSMFIEQAVRQYLDLNKPLTALDLCGAPGGKSTHLASLLHRESLLVSNEIIRSRVTVLAENTRKWGTGNILVTNNDPRDFSRLPDFFDLVLLDAPCSGEGLFRKEPQAVNEWSEKSVELCAARQRRIMADAWKTLKPGGILVYSTCTFNRLENEDNLLWLQQQFDAESLELSIPDEWNIRPSREGKITGYRFYPHRVSGEGFFMAVMRKLPGNDRSGPGKLRKFLSPVSKTEKAVLTEWIKDLQQFEMVKKDNAVVLYGSSGMENLDLVYGNLRVVSGGVTMAEIYGSTLKPHHDLAIYHGIRQEHFINVALDHHSALLFLKKEEVPPLPVSSGDVLVKYQNIPLGWIKKMDNRMNNRYPKEWKIRMPLTDYQMQENIIVV